MRMNVCVYIYIYIYRERERDLGGFKGSATKGRVRKCGLTVFPANCDPKNKARMCNKDLESKKHMFVYKSNPLPWALAVLQAAQRTLAASPYARRLPKLEAAPARPWAAPLV